MKVLISSLGAGRKKNELSHMPGEYATTKYQIDDKLYEEQFIARALVKHLNIEKVFLVGTNRSLWDSVYVSFGGDNEDIAVKIYDLIDQGKLQEQDLKVVEEQIDRHLGTNGSRCMVISYGINDTQLWDNFFKFLSIGDFINSADEIYLDITHSFRSLALMSFVMIEFLKLIREKDVKIKGIYYGMFEYRSENNGIAPVVDLKMFYDLIQWMIAINELKKYGNGNNIAKLLFDTDINKNEIKETANIFKRFSSSINIGDMNNIRQAIRYIKSKISKIENIQHPIARLMIPELKNFISRLDKNTISEFQFELAKWFRDHEFYALSYMALVESIVTKQCELEEKELTDSDARNELRKGLREQFKNFKEMNRIRNDIAHLNYYKRTFNSDVKIGKLNEYINWAKKEFFN